MPAEVEPTIVHTWNCAMWQFAKGFQGYDPWKGYLVFGKWVDDEPDCNCGAYDLEDQR